MLYIVFAIGMPLTFFGHGRDVRLTAWAWFLDLILIGSAVLVGPVHTRAVRYLSPYLSFLAFSALSLAWTLDLQKGVLGFLQMVVPALAYLLAWRMRSRATELSERIVQACKMALGIALVLWLSVALGIAALGLNLRPTAMSLTIIFIGVTLNAKSWHWTTLTGFIVILIAVGTGSRMATLILFTLLICSPSLKIDMLTRILVAGLISLVLLQASQTAVFKSRFFFNSDASLIDVLTLSDRLNTAGRREIWPKIVRNCSSAAVFGKGIGSASLIATAEGGVFGQPHNDYLRTYCDTGLTGSILFWAFFLFAGVRSLRRTRRLDPDHRLHAAAGLLVLSFLIFAVTDNPMVYTGGFMTPFAAFLGLSDATWHRDEELRM